MPRCNSCSRNYDDPNQLELVRNADNRWVSVCRACLDKGVDLKAIQPGIAVDPAALLAEDTPAITVTSSENPLEDAKNLLDALRNLRQATTHKGRARTHERKQIEMVVYFTLARDDTRHEATVKDYSHGGLKIVTGLALAKGQVLQFDWNIPLPPTVARVLQNTAEVRRVTRTESGLYEVGMKFLARPSDKGANRRRFRRYKCDMLAFYQRRGSDMTTAGRVKDISQGGCQMRLDEKLDSGEVFEVRLIGGGGARGDLVGNMRVCRVSKKEAEFETGCAFEQMRMEKQATG